MFRIRFALHNLSIIALATFASVASAQVGTAAINTKVAPAAPCCSITAIDAATGIVTAKTATGKSFKFQVGKFQPVDGFTAKTGIGPIDGIGPVDAFKVNPVGPVDGVVSVNGAGPVDGAKLLSGMRVGQKIWANVAGQVSVNGAEPCCGVILPSH